MMWGNDCWGGWGPGMGIAGMIMMLVFWALIIAGMVLLFSWLLRSKKKEFPGSGETPLDILKKRYARGEISKDDFDRIKKDLVS
jgi:putative membrane protein